MQTVSTRVRIGNFIYTSFPVYREIERLRGDAVQKLMVFFRMIGLNTPQKINEMIGNEKNDPRIGNLLSKNRIIESVSEEASKENMRETEEMQKRLVADDGQTHVIDMSVIAAKVQQIHYGGPEKALREILEDSDHLAFPKTTEERQPAKNNESTEPPQERAQDKKTDVPASEPVKEPDPAPAPTTELAKEPDPAQNPERAIEEVGPQTDPKIIQLLKQAKECQLKLRKGEDHAIVLSDRDYLEALFKYFPSVSYDLMAKYLFDNSISPARVSALVRNTGVEKYNTRHPTGEAMNHIIYERAAFVCWADGDWKTYLKDALKLARDNEKEMGIRVSMGIRRNRDNQIATAQTGEKPLAKDSVEATQPNSIQAPVPTTTNIEENKSANPAPVIARQPETNPVAQPIQHEKGNFIVTMEFSVTAGRDAIYSFIKNNMSEQSSFKLNAFRIEPDKSLSDSR